MPDFAETQLLDDGNQPMRPPALQARRTLPSPIPFPGKPMLRGEAADLARERKAQQVKREREQREELAVARSEAYANGHKHGLASARAHWYWGAGTGALVGATLVLLIPFLVR